MSIQKMFEAGKLALPLIVLIALTQAACGPKSPGSTSDSKRMPANQEYSGFLKDYSQLTANPELDGDVKVFHNVSAEKNLHRYIAVVVDPVEVYLASDADGAKIPAKNREAAANYFRAALVRAVSDAFAPVDEPGPLVLRLRAAIVGVDVGGSIAPADKASGEEEGGGQAVNISKVGVEMELVDSVTGERIAAVVDKEPLGDGAEIAAGNVTRHEKSLAARQAFDEWASRLRTFLNSAHELKGEDVKRADESYQPYGTAAAVK